MHLKIVAVVVTYNKPELLRQCISALLQQTHRCSDIVLIDNGGKSETDNIVKSLQGRSIAIHHIVMNENLGGAGGFSRGIIEAQSYDPDFVWIMDDDTIPNQDALEKLIFADKYLRVEEGISPSILASNVRWIDGSSAVMNRPRYSEVKNGTYANANIRSIISSSFVSMLVRNDTIKVVGLPIGEFFIWGDDTEFSRRISLHYPAFWVKSSVVTHMMASNIGPNIRKEKDVNRLGRYYYEFRNRIFILRKFDSSVSLTKKVIKNLIIALLVLFLPDGFNRAKIVIRGTLAGFSFNPRVRFLENR